METLLPVTLLTGFLGAGKTTVLNAILSGKQGARIAVVVNEFGDVGLDHDLVQDTAEDIVLMAAGCICCSIRGDLSKTLNDLLDRRAAGELDFERIVIETTGLADPGPVHHTLLVDRSLAPRVALDGIVTVVDMVLGAQTLERYPEAQAQVAMADRLILSKNDLAAAPDRLTLNKRLDELNAASPRIVANKGVLPAGSLFDISALRKPPSHGKAMTWLAPFENSQATDPLAGLSGVTLPPKAPIGHLLHPASSSHNRIATASITVETPISPRVFDLWLDTLVALRGPDILRLKGIVHLEGIGTPFVFHGVQHIFEPPLPLASWPDGKTQSSVVIIARNFEQAELEACLALLSKSAEDLRETAGITTHLLETEEL